MNDDLLNTTFIYFSQGTVQDLDKGEVHEYGEHCLWLDENDHKKLEAALRSEPLSLTVFNEKEMVLIKRIIEEASASYRNPTRGVSVEDFLGKPCTMSDQEWNSFLEKLEE
jgi:hypothetical protein